MREHSVAKRSRELISHQDSGLVINDKWNRLVHRYRNFYVKKYSIYSELLTIKLKRHKLTVCTEATVICRSRPVYLPTRLNNYPLLSGWWAHWERRCASSVERSVARLSCFLVRLVLLYNLLRATRFIWVLQFSDACIWSLLPSSLSNISRWSVAGCIQQSSWT